MSGLNLSLQAQTAPALTPLPSSFQAMLNAVAQYVSIQGGGAFNGINFGSQTPAPQNRGLPWFKTDASGNPLGLFSWNGTAWVSIPTGAASGPTSSYPSNPANGALFYDTTLNCLVMFNASQNAWTTASGVPGDVKFVTATTIAAALASNPGWAQYTAANGCVLGASGDATSIAAAHAQGTVVGEENHTLTINELAAHVHAEIYGTYTGAFQNGPQPSGVYPAVTPGTSAVPLANTASTGGGAAHNTLQPTLYLFCLYKVY